MLLRSLYRGQLPFDSAGATMFRLDTQKKTACRGTPSSPSR